MLRKSMEELKTGDREPQTRAYTGKSAFVWPFHRTEIAIQLPLKEKSKSKSRNSLPAGSSKLRMVGRGGSGSQLRKVSLSNTAALSEQGGSRQTPELPESSSSFYRPTGRGGLGSLSTRAPTPMKPPTVILGSLLRGRKQSQAQIEGPPSIRPQSLSSNPESSRVQNGSFTNFSRDYSETVSADSRLERPDTSISQNVDPDQDEDVDLYVEHICPTCHEHRQRSLDKLARITGGLPSSRQLSKRPMRSNNSPEISISTNLGDQSRSFPHNRNRSSSPSYDGNLMDDLSQSWAGLDNRSSFETDSPMAFSPPSPVAVKNTTHPEQTPDGDIDADLTTTSPTTTARNERDLAQSHAPKSPPTRIYVSNHSTSHFDTFDNDLFPDLSGPDSRCDWLVPHSDELVISITRATPSKPQSWTGEWNDDIKDVIKNLRRL